MRTYLFASIFLGLATIALLVLHGYQNNQVLQFAHERALASAALAAVEEPPKTDTERPQLRRDFHQLSRQFKRTNAAFSIEFFKLRVLWYVTIAVVAACVMSLLLAYRRSQRSN